MMEEAKAAEAAATAVARATGTTAEAKVAPEEGKKQEKQGKRERAVAIQLKDSRNAAEVEKTRQERQLQDQVREPLGVIDMPELVPGEFEVFVSTLTREVFMVVTRPTDLVENIKDAIFDVKGVPQIQQRLILDGKQLVDGQTAGSYMMVQGDVLFLVLRLRGAAVETCTTPTAPRHSHRESAVDVRPMEERVSHARVLYRKLHKDRRVMFVNRTNRFVYVYVFPGQERHLDITSVAASASTPAGSVSLGVAAQTTTKAHDGAFKPATIPLRGTSSSTAAPQSDPAAVLPPFEVFDIWKNTGRRVHYMVVSLEGDHVLVWKRGDIEGGKQVHLQQAMFAAEVVPLFKKKYVTADGEANALSVVVKEFL